VPDTKYDKHLALASGIWHLKSDILHSMLSLILATESVASNPPGDDLATIAYIAFGIAMVFTAIATVIVTPSAPKH